MKLVLGLSSVEFGLGLGDSARFWPDYSQQLHIVTNGRDNEVGHSAATREGF